MRAGAERVDAIKGAPIINVAREELPYPDALMLPQQLRLWSAAADPLHGHTLISDWEAPSELN